MTSSVHEHIYALKEKASELVTRDVGKRLRKELLELDRGFPDSERIVIDVSGVDVLTPSFVDEFFGRVVAEVGVARFKSRFEIRGADRDWKSLINSVVRNRLLLNRQSAKR